MLSVTIYFIVMLNVIMLSVVAPLWITIYISNELSSKYIENVLTVKRFQSPYWL
jgi:hypothetical protein